MLRVEIIEAQLPLLRHVVDFGLVVLIWLVQLIIYPSFRYVDRTQLELWHKRYVARITAVVGPLMIAQVLVLSLQVTLEMNWLHALSLVLVGFCWLSSFGLSIPCHRKIEHGQGTADVLECLVRTNWPRTVLWTAVFVLGLL